MGTLGLMFVTKTQGLKVAYGSLGLGTCVIYAKKLSLHGLFLIPKTASFYVGSSVIDAVAVVVCSFYVL